MKKTILTTAVILGLTGIVLGAFAAHGLEKVVEADAITSFETGVRYQLYHTFFLLFLGLWDGIGRKAKRTIYILVLSGVLLFSVSIYALVLSKAFSYNLSFIGPVTPFGGILLISGWSYLLFKLLAKKK